MRWTNGSPEFTDGQLSAALFPNGNLVRSEHGRSVRVVTDSPGLNAKKLAARLGEVEAVVRAELPFVEAPESPPTILVFARDDDYLRFPARLAKTWNSDADEPSGAGYSLRGVSGSTWSADRGEARPVYTHEYVHALLVKGARLPSRGDWLHEGLAVHFQQRFHPQPGLSAAIRDGLDDALPLPQLCDGRPVPLDHYWQALSLIEYFLAARPTQFAALVTALRNAGSADLGPHIQTVLQTDWASLTLAWRTHCQKKR
jgi:hypothetical protein